MFKGNLKVWSAWGRHGACPVYKPSPGVALLTEEPADFIFNNLSDKDCKTSSCPVLKLVFEQKTQSGVMYWILLTTRGIQQIGKIEAAFYLNTIVANVH